MVKAYALKLWGKDGLCDVFLKEGFYLFHIPNAEARKKILEMGNWLFGNSHIILQQWEPSISLRKKKQATEIPIWVKFFDVPLAMWTVKGLARIASGVGRPLYADAITEKLRGANFARICVEVKAGAKLPEILYIRYLGGTLTCRVEYQWCPLQCVACGVFGHDCLANKRSKEQGARSKEQGARSKEQGIRSIDNEGLKNLASAGVGASGSGLAASSSAALISEINRVSEVELVPLSCRVQNGPEVLNSGLNRGAAGSEFSGQNLFSAAIEAPSSVSVQNGSAVPNAGQFQGSAVKETQFSARVPSSSALQGLAECSSAGQDSVNVISGPEILPNTTVLGPEFSGQQGAEGFSSPTRTSKVQDRVAEAVGAAASTSNTFASLQDHPVVDVPSDKQLRKEEKKAARARQKKMSKEEAKTAARREADQISDRARR